MSDKARLSLHDACVLAEHINARPHWRVINIYDDTAPDAWYYAIRAHNCGVIFTFAHAVSDEELEYLETYGM